MTQEQREKQIDELFAQAVQLPPEKRSDFLVQACGGEATLQAELETLVRHHEQASTDFMKPSVRLLFRNIEQARREMEVTLAKAERIGDLPVDSIEGYKITKKLDGGGQGVVYQAVQNDPPRKVAIKVMKEGPFAGPADIARFKREVQVLGQLQHPNIVTIHSSGRAAGCFYFVMDYIPGESLDAYMASADLTIDETLRLFTTICDAVNAAHLRGVIHRDLKPRNIRIDPSGQPHVLDFGLAKVAGADVFEDGRPMLVSMTGEVLGTLPYLSPEQAEGQPSKIDVRTDVYSLGVILYQMLTGMLPYDDGGGMRAVLDRIIKADPARPSTIRKEIDDEVDTIVRTCLYKERERRYQTAGEVARDISRYLTGHPITAKGDIGWYIFRKWIHRNKGKLAIVALVFLCFAGVGAGVYYWRYAAFKEAEKHFFEAAFYSGVGRYKECVSAYQQGLAQHPDNANAWFNLGLAHESIGDAQAAEGAFRRAQALAPDDPWPINRLAYIMIGQGRWDGAFGFFDQLLRLTPNDHAAQLCRCIMLDRLGRLPEAVSAYEEYIRDHPDDSAALHNLALLYLVAPQAEFRNPQKAISLLEKATQISPNVIGFNVARAIAYVQDGRLREAEQTIEDSQNKEGNYAPEEHLVLAMLARAKGDSAAAQKHLNIARSNFATLSAMDKVDAERILGMFIEFDRLGFTKSDPEFGGKPDRNVE